MDYDILSLREIKHTAAVFRNIGKGIYDYRRCVLVKLACRAVILNIENIFFP